LGQINNALIKRIKIAYVNNFKNIKTILLHLKKKKIILNFAPIKNDRFIILLPVKTIFNQDQALTKNFYKIYSTGGRKEYWTRFHLSTSLFKNAPEQDFILHTKLGILLGKNLRQGGGIPFLKLY
jgi:ribosomal protein S8